MKYILTTVLTLLLANTAVAMDQQPGNADRARQSEKTNDQKSKEQKGKEHKQVPAQSRDQSRPQEQKQVPVQNREQARPQEQRQAPVQNREQARPQEQKQAPVQDREQARPQEQKQAPVQNREQARPQEQRQAPVQNREQARPQEHRQAPVQNREQAHPNMQEPRRDDSGRSTPSRWSRGDRLPTEYRQNQYVVSDWRQHGLRQPPRGYHWVRNNNNDFFLAVISTWVIGEVIYRDDRDQRWRQRYSHTYTYNDDIYYRECRNGPDPAGVIIGALIGGLLGNTAGRGGDRGGATIAGVIVGGAVGAALTNNLDCEDRSYAYRSYYDGFNAGRPNATYRWNNPHNSHRGEFHVNNYYNDQAGFRCANYRQTIYIQGRRLDSRGVACRQPDGVWAIVN